MKKVYTIEQFGAVADGVTDNSEAFSRAFECVKNSGDEIEIYFSPKAAYYFVGIGMEPSESALVLKNLKNLTLIGDDTVILCGNARPYMYMDGCENVTVKGLIFDQKTRAHFVGEICEVDAENLTAVVKADRSFPMEEHYNADHGCYFGVHDTGEKLSRIYYFIEGYDWVDRKRRLLKVRFQSEDCIGTHYNVKNRLNKGQRLILPTPGIGHCGHRAFTIQYNSNISFIDCKLWNAPYFVFALWNNRGTVLFRNFSAAPPIEETVDFVSWRDTFHCKTNTAKIIWDGCTVRGSNDDIINLSVNMLYISKFNSSTDIECVWKETGGSYCSERFDITGEPVVIWNLKTGKLLGRTKIKSVVDYEKNHYILEDPIDSSQTGEDVKLCVESHIAPGSVIKNCDFRGTLRIKCNHTVKDSKLYLLRMWIDFAKDWEGPLPHDVLFENVDFYVDDPDDKTYIISCYNSVFDKKTGDCYRLENIVFRNCRGLRKGNFLYDVNFEENSVDEISIC